jgi:hypothetical protein
VVVALRFSGGSAGVGGDRARIGGDGARVGGDGGAGGGRDGMTARSGGGVRELGRNTGRETKQGERKVVALHIE